MADQKPKLVVIEKNCRYCQACMLACSMIHEQGNSSLEKARLSIKREISDNKVTITICRHCAQAKCLDDCPTSAISRTSTGIVIIDEQDCIACGNCQKNCPFEAIIYIKDRNKYQKCDLCLGREEGPLCVAICPVKAIILN